MHSRFPALDHKVVNEFARLIQRLGPNTCSAGHNILHLETRHHLL